jgi:hypothetical protein
MNESQSMETLIEAAATAVERARAHVFEGRETVPAFGPTEFIALSPAAQEDVRHIEKDACLAHPERVALYLCMTSMSHLLDISRSLLQEATGDSPHERLRRNNRLVDDAKEAGRAAYRAALVMSDESAN